jgi:hypothetical protein
MALNNPAEIGAYPRNPSQLSGAVTASTFAPLDINTLSAECYGVKALLAGINSAPPTTTGTTMTTASQAICMPITVVSTFNMKNVWWLNSGTVAGNIDFGVYNATTLAKVASIGLTAQSGANALQTAALAATLSPGIYYMCIVNDNATAMLKTLVVDAAVNFFPMAFGAAIMAAATPLPTVLVPTSASTIALADTAISNQLAPMMGITQRSFV